MKIKVAIVEDETLVAADLSLQLKKAGMDVINVSESGAEILSFLNHDIPDVILMDIQLYGDMDGVEAAHEINKAHDIPIVFLTANTDQATFKRAKLTFPHAFLSKPFRISDVLHTLALALDVKPVKENTDTSKYLSDRIFIRHQNHLEKVMYDDIQIIEANGSYTNVITSRQKYVLSQTMSKVAEKIDAPFLVRVHRSHIVNMYKIDKITDIQVYVEGHKVPVSRTYRTWMIYLIRCR